MINYAVISDIHLYHRKTPTRHILKSLELWYKTYHHRLKDIDVLFVAGDVFDRSVMSSHPDVRLVIRGLYRLGLYCRNNSIQLVFLEGTVWHDRQQMSILMPMLKGIDKLEVDYISTIDIKTYKDTSVLFVPDNVNSDSKVVYQLVLDKLAEHNYNTVDIAIMHGAFDYQLPAIVENTHVRVDYEAIVKYFIHPGHIHIPSHKGKVYAQGSFDRLNHGEEHSKGGYLVKNNKATRLINHNAFVYRQIKLVKDLNKAQQQITDICNMLVETGGYLKLLVSRDHPVLQHLASISKSYLNITIERAYQETKPATQEHAPKTNIHITDTLEQLEDYVASLDIEEKDQIVDYIKDKAKECKHV